MSTTDYSQLLKSRQFDHTKNIVADKIYFTIQDAVIGTSGNFVTFTGLPKAGKSTFISTLISSFLLQDRVWSMQVHSYKDKDRIAIFDTEQSPYDFNRTIKRIETTTGFTRPELFKNVDAFLMREDSATTILRTIDHYLKNNPATGIIIIDGLLDCIESFNDEVASKRLIQVLKRWGKKHDVLIVTVIHLGKKDNNSIGHLGSASDRYAQSTLMIEKTKQGTYVLSPKFLRSAKDFNNIEIMWSETDKKFITV